MTTNTQFAVARGETWDLPVTLLDGASNPKDITDYTFTGSLKPSYESATSYDFTFLKTPPYSSGSFVISLDTLNMPADTYVYSVFANDGTDRRVLLEGKFVIWNSTL